MGDYATGNIFFYQIEDIYFICVRYPALTEDSYGYGVGEDGDLVIPKLEVKDYYQFEFSTHAKDLNNALQGFKYIGKE